MTVDIQKLMGEVIPSPNEEIKNAEYLLEQLLQVLIEEEASLTILK
jgi:hypothetical protein